MSQLILSAKISGANYLTRALSLFMEIEPVNMVEMETTCSLSWTKEKHIDSGTIAINWKKICFLQKSNSVENMTEHWLCVVQTWISSTICAVTVRRKSIWRSCIRPT